jgi:hypothetical protein
MRSILQSRLFQVLLSVIVALLCVAMCCTIWFAYVVTTDEEYTTLVDTKVLIDASALPEEPAIGDWYAIAVQVLKDNDWGLSPNLTSAFYGSLPCQSGPVLDTLTMNFADAYFNGAIPSVKYAEIILNRSNSTASVHIYYSPMRWLHPSLRLSGVEVDFYEALEIADRQGGQEFRDRVGDACDIGFLIGSDYTWKIDYRKQAQYRERWGIWVNARTGEAKQHQEPTLNE